MSNMASHCEERKFSSFAVCSNYCTSFGSFGTVLAEIIRDSKNFFFFRDREVLWSKFQDRELLGSPIIRHIYVYIRICARKSVCTAPHTRTRVYRCKGDGCSRNLYRRRCGAGGHERKDSIVNRVVLCSTACWTSSVTSAMVRGVTLYT